jgi:hypothetical protein
MKGRLGHDVVSLEFIHWLWHSALIINKDWVMARRQLSVLPVAKGKPGINLSGYLFLACEQTPHPLIQMGA